MIVGIRRDEEATRAKERYFSPRDKNMEWNVQGPAAGVLGPVQDGFRPGHAHPDPSAAALDRRSTSGNTSSGRTSRSSPSTSPTSKGERYRSLGCAPCTSRSSPTPAPCARSSRNCAPRKTSERSGRAQDQESEDAFEKLRRDGYM